MSSRLGARDSSNKVTCGNRLGAGSGSLVVCRGLGLVLYAGSVMADISHDAKSQSLLTGIFVGVMAGWGGCLG